MGLCGFLWFSYRIMWVSLWFFLFCVGFLWFCNWFVYGFDQRKLGSNLPSYACNNTLNEGWCET